MKKLIKKLFPFSSIIYRKLILFIHSRMNDEQIKKYIENKYYKIFSRKLNWDNPKTYTEKMNISKYLYATQIKKQLTDKVEVRKWIKEKIGEEYLVPIIGIYETFEDIPFENLPQKFVIKCSHDSNSVTIVDNKNTINIKSLKKKYKELLKRKYEYYQFEMHYAGIKPKIIVEKYLGKSIKDYKFLCFGGKPYYCWIDYDRFTNHKRNIYDMNYQLQDWNQRYDVNYQDVINKPENYDKMKSIVETLCKNFDHVRVDLYEINKKIYFGEMTFTNGSGLEPIKPIEIDYKLGELWKLKK